MALISCPECGREISSLAQSCPHCGCPISEQKSNITSNATTDNHNDVEKKSFNDPIEAAEKGYTKCLKCGEYYPKTNECCPNCGQANSGKRQAAVSLVLGIISIVLWFWGNLAVLSILLGIVGIVLANSAKKNCGQNSISSAGFVVSLIGLIGGILLMVLPSMRIALNFLRVL